MNPIVELLPEDQRYMADAWLAFVSFLAGDVDAVEAFNRDTGGAYRPGTSPIDREIDKATERDQEIALAFARWALKMWEGGPHE